MEAAMNNTGTAFCPLPLGKAPSQPTLLLHAGQLAPGIPCVCSSLGTALLVITFLFFLTLGNVGSFSVESGQT